MISAIISASTYYLLPVIIGCSIITLIKKRHQLSLPLVSYFVIGALVIFIIGLLTRYVLSPILTQYGFIPLFMFLLIIVGFSALVVDVICWRKAHFSRPFKYLLPVAISLILAILASIIWTHQSPYPLNWDFLEHQTLVNNILQGNFSYFTSEITDSFIFNSYSSVFHLQLTASQMFFNPSIIDFWQSISFIHLFIVILASYIMAFVVSGQKSVAILTAIISTFAFETVAFTSFFFIPQTVTAVVFIFLFSQLLQEIKEDRVMPLWLVIAGCIFLFLTHYVVGVVASVIYFGTYLFIRYGAWLKTKINFTSLIELIILGAIFLIIFSSFVSSGAINQGEGSFFNFSFNEKLAFLQEAYGYLLFVFLPLGIIAVAKKRLLPEIMMLIIAFVLLALVFMQFAYVFKFYVLARYFVIFLIALGINIFFDRIKANFLRLGLYLSLIACLCVILILNSAYWKNNLFYQNMLTQIAPREISTALFLKSNTLPQDTLLISDPATQNIIETFSGLNSQGGVYMDQKTRDILIKIGQSNDQAEIKKLLFQINDQITTSKESRIWILSGRYFDWQAESIENKKSLAFNVWIPADLAFNNNKYIDWILQNPNFKLLFHNQSLAVIEVLPE